MIQLKVVVFPEPFGPMRPKISPFSTLKLTLVYRHQTAEGFCETLVIQGVPLLLFASFQLVSRIRNTFLLIFFQSPYHTPFARNRITKITSRPKTRACP